MSEYKSEHTQMINAAVIWILNSIQPDHGSAAFYLPFVRWSASYPETTGYIIPTLLQVKHRVDSDISLHIEKMAQWLLNIQTKQGYWYGGLANAKKKKASIFNTGQIIIGMVALYDETGEEHFLNAALTAATWLASVCNNEGIFTEGHYINNFNPSYYTRVAWPMLMVAQRTQNKEIEKSALQCLDFIAGKVNSNGSIKDWGFFPNKPAFTHTIAYTLRGFLEADQILAQTKYTEICSKAIYKLADNAIEYNGKLFSAYDQNWHPHFQSSCLTGNVQLAIIMLMLYRNNEPAPKLLHAAKVIIKYVSEKQGSGLITSILPNIKGGIPGSSPFLGQYLRCRYPNWATKFFIDAILELEKTQLLMERN